MAATSEFRDRLQLPPNRRYRSRGGSHSNNSGSSASGLSSPGSSRETEDVPESRPELSDIIGSNVPPLAIAPGRPSQAGPSRTSSKASKWVNVPFKNSARKDGLELCHWVPETSLQTDSPSDYHFAAFNAPPNVYSYSPDEYTNLLQDEDWTREETEYLFRLCQQYDLRFIVIHDRYDYPSARTPRSLEDLKARYYDCCRKLIAGRPAADEQAKNLAMNSYVFNKALEAHRKGYVRSLMGRTEEELEEERLLYVASRRLEQTYSRTVKEREHLLRTFGGPGSGAPRRENDITFLNNTTTGASQGPRLVGAAATAAANKAANANRATAKAASVAQVPADPAFDAQHCITRLEASGQVTLNSFGLPRSGVYSTGGPSVALRTARMPAVKPLLAPKIGEALAEMSLSSKLIMPTCANQEKLEALNAALSQLVELKRTVERAEYEVGVLERTTNPHATPAESEPPEGSSVPPVGGDTSMADESVEIPATQAQRSASVSSTRSGSRPPQKKKRKR